MRIIALEVQDVFRHVEKELYSYRDYKALLYNLEEQAENMISLPSAQGSENERVAGGRISDPTPLQALRIHKLNDRRAKYARFIVNAIDRFLEDITAEERKLVELKYFKQTHNNVGVALELNISERDFYRKRENLVESLAIRLGFF